MSVPCNGHQELYIIRVPMTRSAASRVADSSCGPVGAASKCLCLGDRECNSEILVVADKLARIGADCRLPTACGASMGRRVQV